MKAYTEMSAEELMSEKQSLLKRVEEFKAMNLALDMTRGKPSPDQLALSNELFEGLKDSSFTSKSGADVRNYGVPDGIVEARELFAEVLDTEKENIYIGNGSSLNLMFDALMRAYVFGEHDSEKPWGQIENKKWLCPVPGYDRHFKVTETLGFELIPVPLKEDGPDMDIVEELVKDPTVLGMWSVPCYTNPDGYVYSEAVCKRLASMKTAAKDFRIFWDNAYCVHHLYDEPEKQESIPDMLRLCKEAGNASRVYEFSSTSKITFAGAGLSCFATNEENMKHSKKFTSVQTIGANKINQYAHILFMPDLAAMKKQMSKHAAFLRPKFELTLSIMDKELEGTGAVRWHKPNGGYFISAYVFPGTAKATVAMCKDLGVAFTPAGATYPYGNDPDDSNIRIAPSFPSLADIEKAVEVFCVCAKLTAIEKIEEAL
ncbi:DNA-binding transcriptional regulator, MocR family, contains an aminotransferase domain [Oscillospiraceae bacterium]|nr:DNA-binding transcriptional regulator, MocR family, contains an aminotransferase domain [Oscillospiraceae bacterium]